MKALPCWGLETLAIKKIKIKNSVLPYVIISSLRSVIGCICNNQIKLGEMINILHETVFMKASSKDLQMWILKDELKTQIDINY